MSRQIQIKQEQDYLRKALESCSTILVKGSSFILLKRFREVIRESVGSDDYELIMSDNHPDVLLIDGKETETQEVKSIRDNVTSLPSRLKLRYLIISNTDRLHHNAVQSLLKLVEEPPSHLKVIVSTNRPWAVAPTIHSRSIQLEISPLPSSELEDDLRILALDEPLWRAAICGGIPEVAKDLDVRITREWHRLWSSIAGGSSPPQDMPYLWSDRLQSSNESTILACLFTTIKLATKKVHHSCWKDIAIWSINERERQLRGKSNKIRLVTVVTHLYAYAKAAVKK